MKKTLAFLVATTAITLPGLAMARPVTLKATLNNYGGNRAYLAIYATDASGAYAGTLWVAGSRSRYYRHLGDWYRATGGSSAEYNGLTGASVGSGRTLEVRLDLADALFDAGYTLHVDAAAEHFRESPNDVSIPLTSDNAGEAVRGRRYIRNFTYDM